MRVVELIGGPLDGEKRAVPEEFLTPKGVVFHLPRYRAFAPMVPPTVDVLTESPHHRYYPFVDMCGDIYLKSELCW